MGNTQQTIQFSRKATGHLLRLQRQNVTQLRPIFCRNGLTVGNTIWVQGIIIFAKETCTVHSNISIIRVDPHNGESFKLYPKETTDLTYETYQFILDTIADDQYILRSR